MEDRSELNKKIKSFFHLNQKGEEMSVNLVKSKRYRGLGALRYDQSKFLKISFHVFCKFLPCLATMSGYTNRKSNIDNIKGIQILKCFYKHNFTLH